MRQGLFLRMQQFPSLALECKTIRRRKLFLPFCHLQVELPFLQHLFQSKEPKKKWKTCPKCQAKIKELGLKNEEDLQGWFNNQILQYLKTKNKAMIGWNEILKATELSDETIIQLAYEGKC